MVWNSFAFSMIQLMLAIWSVVPLPFLNPACTSGSSRFTCCWSLPWTFMSVTLLACEISAILVVWTFLILTFFGIVMKADFFQSCDLCYVFQICWHIECSILIASFFRTWNSSAGSPSSPLALFVVMFPKADVALYSRMSGSRWVNTPSWLLGH